VGLEIMEIPVCSCYAFWGCNSGEEEMLLAGTPITWSDGAFRLHDEDGIGWVGVAGGWWS